MSDTDKINLFLCEDSMEYVKATKEVLANIGDIFNILLFSSPAALINALRRANTAQGPVPDIVVTTVEFEKSEVDGVQLTTAAKALVDGVVVICTGKSFGTYGEGTNITIEAMKYGCDAWVRKDYAYVEELLHKLRHWSRYVQERYKLRQMYNTISVRAAQNA